MNKPTEVEVREHTAPIMHDADYIRLRLDTQKLHTDILNYLQGTTTVLKYDENVGTYVENVISSGVPLANQQGIQAILSFVVSVINTHTIQGNFQRNDYIKILKVAELQFAEWLALNYDDWGINPNNRDHIIDTIMTMVQLVLSRTVDNKERDSYSNKMGSISQFYNTDKNKAAKVI